MTPVDGSCFSRQCIGHEVATILTGIEPDRECVPVPEVQPFCQPAIPVVVFHNNWEVYTLLAKTLELLKP